MTKDIKMISPEMIPNLLAALCRKVKSLEKAVKRKNAVPAKKTWCASSLRKSELAYIFYILMDEGILFRDELDPAKNRTLLQVFFETNFTYKGDAGAQMPLQSISREFSEAKGFTYREKQLRLLDRIILRLEQRRQNLNN
jgi:hypothetical protein